MATDLTSVAIKDGFSQLLHCDGGLASTETAVLDGDGTSSTLSLGTGSATIAGNLVISGNLTVSGTTTEINTQTLNVADNIVVLNNDVTGTPSQNAGIEVERGTSTNTLLRWNESSDRWQFTNDGSTYYNIPLSTEYNNYTLPTASSSTLGGIKVGTNLSIDGNGVLSASGSFTSFTIADSDSTQAIGDGVHIKFAASNSGAYGNSEISGSGTSGSPYVITLYAPDTDNNTTDLNTLSAGTINTANDSFGFIDADDSNASKKESIADFLTAIAGSGISASSGQLSRDSIALNGLSNVSSATPSTGQYLVYGGSQWEPTSVTAMTSWYLKDGDTTSVQVTNGKYVKFVEGNNLIDINFTDTDSGAVDDEFDVTFTVNSSNITSIGTITSGTWNGGVIASAYLDADTAHLSGSTFTGNIGVSNTGPEITLTDTNASNRYGSIYYGTRAFIFSNILNNESLSSLEPYIEFRFATAVDGTYSSALKLDYDLSATFGGAITAGHNSKITSSSADTTFAIETTSGTSIFPVLNFISSHSSAGARIRVGGSDVISIDKDQDVTFADDVHISGNLTVGGTAPYLTNITGERIDSLVDVAALHTGGGSGYGNISNGQVLVWNSTANYFEPGSSSYSWYLKDGDTTSVQVTSGKYVKLVEGTGIDINFTDTDSGAVDDEFDVTITNTLMSGGNISGTLTTTGNLGVGISSPTTHYEQVIHVHESSGSSAVHLTNNTTGSTANDGTDIIAYQDDFYIWNRESGGHVIIGTNATERFKLESGGNAYFTGDIYVNKASPYLQLGNGGSTTSAAVRVGGDNAAGGRLYLQYNGDSSYIDCYGGHGSTERFRDLSMYARSFTFRTGASTSLGTAFTVDSSQDTTFNGTVQTGSVWMNDGTNYNAYNEGIRVFGPAGNGVSVIAMNTGTSNTSTTNTPRGSLLAYSSYLEIRSDSNAHLRLYTSDTYMLQNTVFSGNIRTATSTDYATLHGIQGGLRVASSRSGDAGILLTNSAGAFRAQLYGDGTNYGFLDAHWGAWDFKKVVNGHGYLRIASADRQIITSVGGTMNSTLGWDTTTAPHITTTGNHGLWLSSNAGDVYLYDGSKNHFFYIYSGTTSNVFLSSTSTSYFRGGNLAVGGTGGYQKLSVEGGNIYMSTGYQITWSNGNATIGNSGYELRFQTYSGSAVIERMRIESDGDVHCDADVIAYSNTIGSDRRLKKNIEDISYGLDDVLKLRGVEFDWNRKDYAKKHDVGFIAQEVREVIPELVKRTSGLNDKGSFLTVDYAKLVPVLVESIKELKQEIEDLKNANS